MKDQYWDGFFRRWTNWQASLEDSAKTLVPHRIVKCWSLKLFVCLLTVSGVPQLGNNGMPIPARGSGLSHLDLGTIM